MHSQMGQMLGQMDRMTSGFGGGFGGGFGAFDLGAGGGGSYSYSSSCCSYSSSGPNGQSVQYSQSSHGVQRPGEEAVHETHRNYNDSAGNERIGVSRTIGQRCATTSPARPPSPRSPPCVKPNGPPLPAPAAGVPSWRSAALTARSGARTTSCG